MTRPNLKDTQASWRLDAACQGMSIDLFFPTDPGGVARARAVCASCPVQVPCEKAGVGLYGVWGGTTGEQRGGIQGRNPVGRQLARHGTRSRYVAGCVCDDCRDANRAYQQARRRVA